jgi:hypothetical protein
VPFRRGGFRTRPPGFIQIQSSQRQRLSYEDNELSRNPGRFFLLSIPDLILDPEGEVTEFIQIEVELRLITWAVP